jgi:hypothetical protein
MSVATETEGPRAKDRAVFRWSVEQFEEGFAGWSGSARPSATAAPIAVSLGRTGSSSCVRNGSIPTLIDSHLAALAERAPRPNKDRYRLIRATRTPSSRRSRLEADREEAVSVGRLRGGC